MGSNTNQEKLNANMIISKQGIFGFGLSHNNNLDFMTIVVLAVMGIVIKLFFPEKFSRLGNTGPATSTIWGYGLTAIALSIMLFMGIYVSKNIFETEGNLIEMLFSNVAPIFLTLVVIIYAIVLNFQYFKRINSNRVTNEYHTYSFMSSVLTIIQIGLVSTYLFYLCVIRLYFCAIRLFISLHNFNNPIFTQIFLILMSCLIFIIVFFIIILLFHAFQQQIICFLYLLLPNHIIIKLSL
jgi:hypothetical protein